MSGALLCNLCKNRPPRLGRVACGPCRDYRTAAEKKSRQRSKRARLGLPAGPTRLIKHKMCTTRGREKRQQAAASALTLTRRAGKRATASAEPEARPSAPKKRARDASAYYTVAGKTCGGCVRRGLRCRWPPPHSNLATCLDCRDGKRKCAILSNHRVPHRPRRRGKTTQSELTAPETNSDSVAPHPPVVPVRAQENATPVPEPEPAMPIPAARALRNNVIDMTLDQDGLELVDGPEAPDVKPLVRRPAVRDEPGDREKLLQMWDLVQNPAYPPNVHRTAGEWVMRYYRARINTDAAIESIGDQLRVAAQFLKDEGHSRARLRQVVQAWFDLAMN